MILEPGDVLFVPRQWWHFVKSLDTTISVNTWIELVILHDRDRFDIRILCRHYVVGSRVELESVP